MIADTPLGRLRGERTGWGLAFRGVRYATAPRFAPPQAVVPWPGVLDAVGPGPAAPQPDREVSRFTHGPLPLQDERACLNLNVFTPALEGRRPVLVWVHGGGFATGHAAASLYEGGRLAQQAEAVVVTLNYRLGSFGWLCARELARSPGVPQGNWGLLDQLAALRWVQENIAAFGGDANQVTLAGQSAGALSALDLLVTPDADGLFHRLILQSPPLADVAQPAERGERWARALSAAAGAAGRTDAERLRALSAPELVDLHEAVLDTPAFRGTRVALPTLDPATLPVSPLEAPGLRPHIEILIGSTAEEGTFFFSSPWRPAPPAERIPDIVAHLCPDEDPLARLARAGEDRQTALVQIATEAMVAGPVRAYATARAAAADAPVYRYRVDHRGAGAVLGATHTVEVPLLFGTWQDAEAGERLAGQASGASEVARELVCAWSRFLHGEGPGWSPAQPDRSLGVGVFGGERPLAVEEETANTILS